MPAFPKSESEVLQLANKMIGGLPQDPIFASAPATPSQLQSATDTFNAASAEMDAAYSLYLSKSQNKNASYVALQGLMKQDINFAENAPGVTQAQLHLIGWDTKAPPTKLEAPGQCLQFELIGVSGHLYDFDWKKPVTGGKPALYELVIRAAGSGSWKLLANDTKRDLEEKVELDAGHWEIAVRAANDAGTGMESNAVAVSVA